MHKYKKMLIHHLFWILIGKDMISREMTIKNKEFDYNDNYKLLISEKVCVSYPKSTEISNISYFLPSGCSNVGGGLVGIINIARMGCTLCKGGSPSPNSIMVMPKLQMSALPS